MQIRVSIMQGHDAGQFHSFQIDESNPIVIGRSEDTDLPLWDESASRRHAQIELQDGKVSIRDLGSANGVHVNGQQIRQVELRSGDRILIGESELRFESGRFHERPTAVLRPDSDESDYTIHSALSRDAVQLGSRMGVDANAGDRLEQLLAFVEDVQTAEGVSEIHGALIDRAKEALGVGQVSLVDPSDSEAELNVSRSVVDRVLADGQALLVADTAEDPRTRERQSIVSRGVRSVMAVPVRARDRVVSVLALESAGSAPFSEEDLAYAATLGQVAGLALENAERLERSRQLLTRNEQARPRLVTEDRDFKSVLSHVEQFAEAGGPVLIVGETGTGKELVARHAHEHGRFQDGPWIPVNCSAIPRELLESELFGHEKGAFTGATQRREGLFELADQGTLFLDEIGDLPIELQPKLLRALETGEFFRVGGSAPVQVDLLVVSATHRRLDREVAEGNFREDLLFRLGRFRVDVPALRERPGDILPIARLFLQSVAEHSDTQLRSFSEAAVAELRAYDWPGNVRELRNVVERAAVIAASAVIEPGDFAFSAPGTSEVQPRTLDEAERAAIRAALAHTDGKKGEAAELLGIAWPTLRRKMKKYGLDEQ